MPVIGHGTEICTSTTRPSTAYEGMMIYETDTNKVLVNSSATLGSPSWVEVSALDNVGSVADAMRFGHIVCTSSTRPTTNLSEGFMIYETDTNKMLVYNGASWVEINDLDNTGAASDALNTRINTLENRFKLYGRVTRTSSVNGSATSFSGVPDFFSPGLTFTSDGTSAYIFEFYCSYITSSTTLSTTLMLNDNGSQGPTLTYVTVPGGYVVPFFLRFFYTPAAGSRTFNVRSTTNSGTSTWNAGSGAAANFLPMHLAVYGPG